jgi:hypothetical protein
MRARWFLVIALWVSTAVCALLAIQFAPVGQAFAWFGAILAGSVATVSLVHLIKAAPTGFVRELVYVGGGSYLILALTSIYLFVKG